MTERIGTGGIAGGDSMISVTLVESGKKVSFQKMDIEGLRDVRRSSPLLNDPIMPPGPPTEARTRITMRNGDEHYVKEELRDILK